MGTTMIPALQTAGEISTALVAAGATSINTDYENGRIVGLDWRMDIGRGQDGIFKMPVRVDPIFRMLNEARTDPVKWQERDYEQAERVAWRQLLRWVQAQCAFIETDMVSPAEVFAPYLIVGNNGETLYEAMIDAKFKLLEKGTENASTTNPAPERSKNS